MNKNYFILARALPLPSPPLSVPKRRNQNDGNQNEETQNEEIFFVFIFLVCFLRFDFFVFFSPIFFHRFHHSLCWFSSFHTETNLHSSRQFDSKLLSKRFQTQTTCQFREVCRNPNPGEKKKNQKSIFFFGQIILYRIFIRSSTFLLAQLAQIPRGDPVKCPSEVTSVRNRKCCLINFAVNRHIGLK